MAIFYPGDDNTGAQHGDILVNGYGERGVIIGETARAWIVLGARDIRRPVLKATPDVLARAIIEVRA